jgi:micrococcal nuclease
MRLPIVLLAALLLIACACAAETAAPATRSATPVVSTPAATTPSSVALPTPGGITQALVVNVVDGDTIDVEIGGETYRVRYIGVDTPETVDPNRPVGCYGPEASAHNKALVAGKTVGLEKDVSETDKYGRLLRYVWLDGEMVNADLVRDGYAQVSTYPPDVKYQDTFLQLQREARDAGRGLWGAVCASPTPAAPPAASGGAVCDYSGTSEPVIKGNISSSGEKIYHVPGQQYYDSTVIDESKGERWFCTELEAQAAGWRKSKV